MNTSKWFWLVLALVLALSQADVSRATLMYHHDYDNSAIKQIDLADGQTTTVASDIGVPFEAITVEQESKIKSA